MAGVAYFYVMDDRLGFKEGREHEKIMFYHPADVPMSYKTQRVGLGEALIHLTTCAFVSSHA